MNIESLSQTIKMALEKYDNINNKYNKYIDNTNFKIEVTSPNITFYFDDYNQEFDYEILGYYDNQNKIWIWSWLIGEFESYKTETSRQLLEYGLKLEPRTNTDDHYYIKSLLVNSRIQIQESIQLEINLAIYSSLMREKIKFIFPRKKIIDETNKTYITLYYLIK